VYDWTAKTLIEHFAKLDGLHAPIFHIELWEESPYFTVVGDAVVGRVLFKYSNNSRVNGKAGYLVDRRMQDNEDCMGIDYGTEHDCIPLKDTITIEDALKITTYFVEHQTLPSLPDHLYWDGWNM
jgi:hypothetical protein